MAGTEAKRVESRRETDVYTASDGTAFPVPPVPWRARNKLADLVIAQSSDSIRRAIVTETDAAGEETTTYHLREYGVDYEGILALGLGAYRDPVTPEPLPGDLKHRIDMLGFPDLLGLTNAVLERNGLERFAYIVDSGKPRPESFLEALGFVVATAEPSDDGQKTPSAPDSPSPDSPEETPTD